MVPVDGPDIAAAALSALGRRVRVVRRRARVRGEPVRGDRAGGARRWRCSPAWRRVLSPRRRGDGRALPGGLGAGRGPRLLRRARHRPEQHDPDGAGGRRRLPGPDPRPGGRGRAAAEPPARMRRRERLRLRRGVGGAGDGAERRHPCRGGWRERLRPAALCASFATATAARCCRRRARRRHLGAAPMAAASARPSAAPILAQAIDGSARRWTSRPRFPLTNQDGQQVTPGQPARQGGPADLPRPGVHVRLPADRPGVPRRPTSCSAPSAAGRAGRDRHQPALLRWPTPGPSTGRNT